MGSAKIFSTFRIKYGFLMVEKGEIFPRFVNNYLYFSSLEWELSLKYIHYNKD